LREKPWVAYRQIHEGVALSGRGREMPHQKNQKPQKTLLQRLNDELLNALKLKVPDTRKSADFNCVKGCAAIKRRDKCRGVYSLILASVISPKDKGGYHAWIRTMNNASKGRSSFFVSRL
jgi:hypothetical protein